MRLVEHARKRGEQRNRGQRAADTVRWPDSALWQQHILVLKLCLWYKPSDWSFVWEHQSGVERGQNCAWIVLFVVPLCCALLCLEEDVRKAHICEASTTFDSLLLDGWKVLQCTTAISSTVANSHSDCNFSKEKVQSLRLPNGNPVEVVRPRDWRECVCHWNDADLSAVPWTCIIATKPRQLKFVSRKLKNYLLVLYVPRYVHSSHVHFFLQKTNRCTWMYECNFSSQ